MKKAIVSILLLSVALICAWSCRKKDTPASTIITSAPTLNQAFAGLRSTPHSLSVTAGRDTIVFGASGTMLHFYVNSFKTAGGSVISGGTINLKLIEMYKIGDMIANRATTTAGGKILQSAGQISISATQGGTVVYANSYGIGFKRATYSPAPMALFYGAVASADSVTTWTQSDSTKNGNIVSGTTTDTVSGGGTHPNSFFRFDSCHNFTWANCDWFYASDSANQSVSVILPDTTFNAGNTEMYLVLPNVNRWGSTADTFTAVLSNTEDYLVLL